MDFWNASRRWNKRADGNSAKGNWATAAGWGSPARCTSPEPPIPSTPTRCRSPACLIAEEIGCDPRDCTVVVSDTDLTPVDLGAYSSRVTFMVGNACIEAGQRLWAQISDAVAEKWAVDRSRIEGELGTLYAPDTDLKMSFRDAVQLTEAKFGTLGSTGSYRTRKLGGSYRGGTIGASPAYSFTAHVVEGQIEGSVYMGFAEAAMEEMTYYPSGLHRGPSLLDYRIPTSLDTPELTALIEIGRAHV